MKADARYLDTEFEKTYAENDGVPFDILFIGKYKYVLDKEYLKKFEEFNLKKDWA